MQTLGGNSGLLDRVDFAGRAASATGAFEIRITANAAKRQIIAVRRDAQRVKAFNSAFEALERSVTSVLKTQPLQAEPARRAPARAPALTLPAAPERARGSSLGRIARAAFALTAALTLLALLVFWWQRGAVEVDVGARGNVAAAPLIEEDSAFIAVAEPAPDAAYRAVADVRMRTR